MPTFETIRWIRVILSTLFIVMAIATVSYWHIRDAQQIGIKYAPPALIARLFTALS